VIFKVLNPPDLSHFSALVREARAIAKQTGLRRSDISKAIAKVRRSR